MTTIAVIGPGAIGGIVAAWLTQNPALTVTLCARTPLADLLIETPEGTISAAPRVVTDPAQTAPVDWVLVATKAYDAPATAPWLARLVSPETRVAILQNGVEHRQRFASLLPAGQIVPAVVDIPANRTGPGRVKQHVFGSIIVPAGADGDAFTALFAHTRIAASTDADFSSRAWQKLCLNSAGAVTALTFAPTGTMWSQPLEAIIRALVEECAAVARAEGATVPQSMLDKLVARAATATGGGRNSLEADRLAGRPMEIDARNGAVVRIGRQYGIATPMNEMFVALLTGAASPWTD